MARLVLSITSKKVFLNIMKAIITLVLVLSLSTGFAQGIDNLLKAPGYRGVWIEMHLDTFLRNVNAEKIIWDNQNGLEEYKIEDSKFLNQQNCPLKIAKAYFYNGQLVKLRMEGLRNFDCVYNSFTQFAPPEAYREDFKTAYWKNYNLLINLNIEVRDPVVTLISLVLDDLYGEYCKDKKIVKYCVRIP